MSKELEQAFSDALGIEAPSETDRRDSEHVEDFFSEAEAEFKGTEAREQPVEEAPKWVHEPTGKEFDSEVDFLRYDAGWKNDQWGKRFQELESRLSGGDGGKSEQTEQKKPLTKAEIKRALWPDQKEEILDDPAFDVFVEGLDNALSLYGSQQNQVISQLQKQVETLQGQLQETSLRTQYGVDPQTEQKLVEKHAWLQGLPADKRMAAMKDLLGQAKAPETDSRKLINKVPQRNAADHVEGSASIVEVPSTDDARTDKFDKLSDKDQLGVLRRMIRGEGTFMGYNPND